MLINVNDNIIVGRLGQTTAIQGVNTRTGKSGITMNQPKLGVVVYANGGIVPTYQFSVNTVKKIIAK